MTYQITLDNSKGGRLGLELDGSNGRNLLITSIMGGLVQEWNTGCDEAQRVRIGHSIIAVNGTHGSSAWLLQEIQKEEVLSITLVSIAASETREICMCICGIWQVNSEESGRYQITLDNADRQTLGLEMDGSDGRTLCITSIYGGFVQEWNETHKDQRIRAGDSILAVNSVHGDSGELLREIHQEQSLRLVLHSCQDHGKGESEPLSGDLFDLSHWLVPPPAPPADVQHRSLSQNEAMFGVASRETQEVMAHAEASRAAFNVLEAEHAARVLEHEATCAELVATHTRMQLEVEQQVATLAQLEEAARKHAVKDRALCAPSLQDQAALESRLCCAEEHRLHLEEHVHAASLAQAQEDQAARALLIREHERRCTQIISERDSLQRELEVQGCRLARLEDISRSEREACARQVREVQLECTQIAASRDEMQHECAQLQARLTHFEEAFRREIEAEREREQELELQSAKLLRFEQERQQNEADHRQLHAEKDHKLELQRMQLLRLEHHREQSDADHRRQEAEKDHRLELQHRQLVRLEQDQQQSDADHRRREAEREHKLEIQHVQLSRLEEDQQRSEANQRQLHAEKDRRLQLQSMQVLHLEQDQQQSESNQRQLHAEKDRRLQHQSMQLLHLEQDQRQLEVEQRELEAKREQDQEFQRLRLLRCEQDQEQIEIRQTRALHERAVALEQLSESHAEMAQLALQLEHAQQELAEHEAVLPQDPEAQLDRLGNFSGKEEITQQMGADSEDARARVSEGSDQQSAQAGSVDLCDHELPSQRIAGDASTEEGAVCNSMSSRRWNHLPSVGTWLVQAPTVEAETDEQLNADIFRTPQPSQPGSLRSLSTLDSSQPSSWRHNLRVCAQLQGPCTATGFLSRFFAYR